MNYQLSKTSLLSESFFFFATDLDESLLSRGNQSGSSTDDDFQPAKKRFRTPGNQVNYKHKWIILLEIIPHGFYSLGICFINQCDSDFTLFQLCLAALFRTALTFFLHKF